MTPPTPLELMALADGELEEPRKSEVERWLAQNPAHQARQHQRQAFHELVGEAARIHRATLPTPDLTNNILDLIDRDSSDRETSPTQSGPRTRQPAEVLPLRGFASRKFVGAMAFGVAAAAAVLLWWKSAPPPPRPEPDLVASVKSPSPDVDDDAVVGDDSAAITSVDFGNQSGAIFYVRGQTTASAVLWIDDTTPKSTP